VIVGCIVFFSCVNLHAQAGNVSFNPETTVVSAIDTFEVNIQVDSNVSAIHCFMVSVQFNRSLVQLVDVVEGSLLSSHGFTQFFWNDNGTGHDIMNCLMGHGLYADGPGVMAVMKFRAKGQAGVTPLTFTYVEFSDTASPAQPIPVNHSDGAIIISGNPVPFLQQKSKVGLFLLLLLTGALFIHKRLQGKNDADALWIYFNANAKNVSDKKCKTANKTHERKWPPC